MLVDSTYFGEIYDARRETPGWDTHAFDARPPAWEPAALVRPGGAGGVTMRAAMMPP
eukprot:COSAG01_NODE_1216_length_11192_cov_10.328678_11_plen_56_part_01